MKKKKSMPLLLVEWVDSHSGKGWQPMSEIEAAARPIHCRSVGWLVSERSGTTVLVAHVSGENVDDIRQFGAGDMAIPTKAIVRRDKLRWRKEPV